MNRRSTANPSGLKPLICDFSGTAEAVPFPNTFMRQLIPIMPKNRISE